MRTLLVMAAAIAFAAAAAAQSDGRRNPADPHAKAPATEFRSAFEGYRPFAEQERRDWRKSNEEVGAAQHTSKPQPGKPETSREHGGGK